MCYHCVAQISLLDGQDVERDLHTHFIVNVVDHTCKVFTYYNYLCCVGVQDKE